MPELRLGGKRTEPKPERRIGIRLAEPASERRLGGKLNAYIPLGAQYDYKPPSVFARYKVVTALFAALALCLAGYWVLVLHRSPPAAAAPTPTPARPEPQTPQTPPVYIEPLPSR